MPSSRRSRTLALPALAGLVLTAVAPSFAAPALAATPATQSVTVPAVGAAPVTLTWHGTIPPGSDPNSDCTTEPDAASDIATVTLAVPDGFYDTATTAAHFAVTWTDASGSNDEIVTVVGPKGELGSGDTSNTTEVVDGRDLAAGAYKVYACGFTTGPQDYTGTLTLTTRAIAPQPSWPSGTVTPTRETVADPFRLGTEPTNALGPDGTVFESQIFGFSTTQSFLQRSVDGGATFNTLSLAPGVGKLDHCTGGGDSSLGTDRYAGDVYMIDLGGAPEVPARVSNDKGGSWSSSCEANFHDGANYFTDRQWLTRDDKHGLMFYIYRDGLLSANPGSVGSVDVGRQVYGEYVKAAPLPTAPGTAGSSQLNFASLCLQQNVATPCVTDVSIAGPAITDNTASSPFYGTSYVPIETGAGLRLIRIDPGNTAKPVDESAYATNAHQVLFPVAAVDRAGTVYLAWTDGSDYQVRYSWSKDRGQTWSAPVVVNGAPAATTVMPAIVAGDAGKVDIAYYGSGLRADPTNNYGPWYLYLDQTLDATDASPQFTQARMSDRPSHIDPVCLSGLGCTTNTGPGGDRELGDFFTMSLDKDGRAVMSFADGDNQLGNEVAGGPAAAPSFAHFVRQATGPSVYGGDVPALDVPTGSVTVADHHDPVPLTTPGTGTPGADNDALKLLGSATSFDKDGNVVVTLHVATLDPVAAVTPPALPVATYLTRFVYKDGVYAVAAEIDGGQWRYFAGPAAPVSDGAAIKYAYYPATTSVTGKADPATNTITVTVPATAVGSPRPSDVLYSVTSYALTHAAPTAPVPPSASNYTDFPQVADVLPAYNTAGSAPGTDVPQAPLAVLLPLGALVVLAGGWALRRRHVA